MDSVGNSSLWPNIASLRYVSSEYPIWRTHHDILIDISKQTMKILIDIDKREKNEPHQYDFFFLFNGRQLDLSLYHTTTFPGKHKVERQHEQKKKTCVWPTKTIRANNISLYPINFTYLLHHKLGMKNPHITNDSWYCNASIRLLQPKKEQRHH